MSGSIKKNDKAAKIQKKLFADLILKCGSAKNAAAFSGINESMIYRYKNNKVSINLRTFLNVYQKAYNKKFDLNVSLNYFE